MKLTTGQSGRFLTSCGQEIQGTVREVCPDGYVVEGDGIRSNLHEDGFFRFTFT